MEIFDNEILLFKVNDDDVSYVGLNVILYSLSLPTFSMRLLYYYKLPTANMFWNSNILNVHIINSFYNSNTVMKLDQLLCDFLEWSLVWLYIYCVQF